MVISAVAYDPESELEISRLIFEFRVAYREICRRQLQRSAVSIFCNYDNCGPTMYWELSAPVFYAEITNAILSLMAVGTIKFRAEKICTITENRSAYLLAERIRNRRYLKMRM